MCDVNVSAQPVRFSCKVIQVPAIYIQKVLRRFPIQVGVHNGPLPLVQNSQQPQKLIVSCIQTRKLASQAV